MKYRRGSQQQKIQRDSHTLARKRSTPGAINQFFADVTMSYQETHSEKCPEEDEVTTGTQSDTRHKIWGNRPQNTEMYDKFENVFSRVR